MEYMSCKFCSDRVEADETEFHGCFVGRVDDVRVDENGILFLVETCDKETEPIPQIGLDEMLIAEVQKYPPLYDCRLQIDQRSRAKRDSCWQKIFDSLRGRIPLKDLPKKWKNERDKYMKAKNENKKYIPSDSASQKKNSPKYKNYALMQFLDDSLQTRQTTSNLNFSATSSQSTDDQNEYDSMDAPASSASTNSVLYSCARDGPQNKRKRSKSSNIEEALLEAIRQPIQMPPPPPPTPPPPPPPPPTPPLVHEVDAFCTRLSASLKRLDPCDRA